MNNINYVSAERYETLKKELHHLKSIERPAASHDIAEAREKGDLKENAEYDAAKQAQGLLESRINNLEENLSNTRVLETKDIDTSRVSILTYVTMSNLGKSDNSPGKKVRYKIVSENEADLKSKKMSVTSPIGKSILGKKIGEIVEVSAPVGILKYRIEKIELFDSEEI